MLYLILKDCRMLLRSKKFYIALFVMLIILIISISCNGDNIEDKKSSTEKIAVGVVDLDHSFYSNMMFQYITENEVFMDYISVVFGTEEEMNLLFEKGEILLLMKIPKNFAESIISIKNVPITFTINSEDTTKALLLKNMLESFEKYIKAVEVNCVALYDRMLKDGLNVAAADKNNVRFSYDLVFTALGKESMFDKKLIDTMEGTSLVRYYSYELLFLLPGFLSIMAGVGLLKEKKNRIMARFFTTGRSCFVFVAEKILVYSILNFVLFLPCYFLLCRILKRAVSLPTILFYSGCLVLLPAISVVCSALLQKLQTYLLLSYMVLLFGAILGGGIIPFMFLPESVLNYALMMPNAIFLNQMVKLEQGTGIEGAVIWLIITLTVSLLCAIITAIFYKRKGGILDAAI